MILNILKAKSSHNLSRLEPTSDVIWL